MLVKRKNLLSECLLGFAIPSAGLLVFTIVEKGLKLEIIFEATFLTLLFSISPFLNLLSPYGDKNYALSLLILLCMTISFFVVVKFVDSPFLRFAVALWFCIWLYWGVICSATLY